MTSASMNECLVPAPCPGCDTAALVPYSDVSLWHAEHPRVTSPDEMKGRTVTLPLLSRTTRSGREPVTGLRKAMPAHGEGDFALLGVPAFRTSITPTGAHATPRAVREALLRYSTYAGSHDVDLSALRCRTTWATSRSPTDPRARSASAAHSRRPRQTSPARRPRRRQLDHVLAHARNGWRGPRGVGPRHGRRAPRPARRRVERLARPAAGRCRTCPARTIVQIGIADFANSAAYAERARDNGITVVLATTSAIATCRRGRRRASHRR